MGSCRRQDSLHEPTHRSERAACIGKSTLALRYVEDHPLALSLEQDVVRGLLGGWSTQETESGTLARELCLCMARTHLLAGYDVVVPQFVALPAYLDRLAELASQVGADHDEFVLLDAAAAAERRFHARLGDPLWTDHQRMAAVFVERAGGYAEEYARLIRGLEGRRVVEIRSVEGATEATYRAFLKHLK